MGNTPGAMREGESTRGIPTYHRLNSATCERSVKSLQASSCTWRLSPIFRSTVMTTSTPLERPAPSEVVVRSRRTQKKLASRVCGRERNYTTRKSRGHGSYSSSRLLHEQGMPYEESCHCESLRTIRPRPALKTRYLSQATSGGFLKRVWRAPSAPNGTALPGLLQRSGQRVRPAHPVLRMPRPKLPRLYKSARHSVRRQGEKHVWQSS